MLVKIRERAAERVRAAAVALVLTLVIPELGFAAPDCPTIEFLPVAELAGACWYPAPDTSCSAICSLAGLPYSSATRTFAGSDGTNANCAAVIAALGETVTITDTDCTSLGISGVGCAVFTEFALSVRCVTPPTTADALELDTARVCACLPPAAIPLFSPLFVLCAVALLAGAMSWTLGRGRTSCPAHGRVPDGA